MANGVDHSFSDRWPSYWGDKTSTLDWCEENYLYSKYIAEFWNSTSNFFFMYVALRGAHDAYKAKLPLRFVVLYLWVFVVGFGSLLFHATLKWSMQLLDEIPMIYMMCHILFCIMYPNSEKEAKKAPWYIKSVVPLYSVAVAVTFAYLYIGNPIFHELCFAVIIVGCVLKYPAFADKNIQALPDEKIVRHKAYKMTLKAAVLMITAFGIWNIDNVACKYLRRVRTVLWGPLLILSPLLQFHAVWHILTVAAADYTVAGITYVWCQGRRKQIRSQLVYKLFGCFPLLKMEPIKRREKERREMKNEHNRLKQTKSK